MKNLIFYTQDKPIGQFQSETYTYPTTTGWHAYEPFRGEGHSLLVQTLNSGNTLTAWFFDEDVERRFEIASESFDAKRADGKWRIHISQFES